MEAEEFAPRMPSDWFLEGCTAAVMRRHARLSDTGTTKHDREDSNRWMIERANTPFFHGWRGRSEITNGSTRSVHATSSCGELTRAAGPSWGV
jgi:hypothetical protein